MKEWSNLGFMRPCLQAEHAVDMLGISQYPPQLVTLDVILGVAEHNIPKSIK